jgi:dihydroxyacetone kinase-like protein
LIAANKEQLTQLDAAIGDADHGTNMDRGMTAVLAALDGDEPPASAAALFKRVGMTLVSTVGGASGPLFGTFFIRFSAAAGDAAQIEPKAFAAALRAGLDGVVARGKAEAGDKTMYDALAPAVDTLDDALAAGADLQSLPRKPDATRPRRCSPARAGPHTSANAASATRTPAPPASRC